MKIQGSDTNWNFDRICRVVIKCAGAPSWTVSDDSGRNVPMNGIFIEYNPIQDERKVARIDFKTETILDLPNVGSNPSNTAEITLYNIGKEAANIITNGGRYIQKIYSGTTSWRDRQDAYRQYKNNMPQIELMVGYANHDNPANSQFSTIFSGIINTSYTYREGQDYVTKLLCWVYSSTLPDEANHYLLPGEQSYEDYQAEIGEDEPYSGTLEQILAKIIIDYETSKPSAKINKFVNGNSFGKTGQTITQFEALEGCTKDDRQKNFNKYYQIEFDPSIGTAIPNREMVFYPQGERNLDRLLNNACSSLTGLNLKCVRDADIANAVEFASQSLSTDFSERSRELSDAAKIKYRVSLSGVSSNKKYDNINTIEIVDFQNVVENPIMQSNGELIVKTMMVPGIKGKNAIKLTLSENASDSVESFGSSSFAQPAVSVSASNAARYTPLATGEYSAAVATQKGTESGYLFNTPFDIWKISYEGSTHDKKWYTTFTTRPSFSGRGRS